MHNFYTHFEGKKLTLGDVKGLDGTLIGFLTPKLICFS